MEIESPVPNLETEWVVLEKDRYIRQRLNSRVAQKNFSRIESIKEELKKMKSENEEILFNAEFGFDNNSAVDSPLFTSVEMEPDNFTPRKSYTERYVSWHEKQKNNKQRPTNMLEKSFSVDNVFQMTFDETEFDQDPRDRNSKNSLTGFPGTIVPRNQLISESEFGTQRLLRRSQGDTFCFDKSHFDLESKRRARRKMSEETNL